MQMAKRQRCYDDVPISIRRAGTLEVTLTEDDAVLAAETLRPDEGFCQGQGVHEKVFLYGFKRSVLDRAFQTETPRRKKRGERDVTTSKLELRLEMQFPGSVGARQREWRALQDFAAVAVLSAEVSKETKRTKKNLVVSMRWADTHKAGEKFRRYGPAKTVQSRGSSGTYWYRRDAPTCCWHG